MNQVASQLFFFFSCLGFVVGSALLKASINRRSILRSSLICCGSTSDFLCEKLPLIFQVEFRLPKLQ